MNWRGSFGYRAIVLGAENNEVTLDVFNSFVPVSYFGVRGGAKRLIDLKSTDDMSLMSEFEQARKLSNLKLYLPPDGKFSSSELIEIALNNTKLSMSLFIGAYNKKSTRYTLTLYCDEATFKEKPQKVAVEGKDHFLVFLDIPTVTLLHGTPNSNVLFGIEHEEL